MNDQTGVRTRRGLASLRAEIAVGLGAIGGVSARYGATIVGQQIGATTFPLAILLVNLVGCFLIGIVQTLFAQRRIGRDLQLFAAVGVLGGFTTFSTFSVDTLRLMENGQILGLALYQLGSLIGGVIAVVAGQAMARSIVRMVDR